MNSCLGQDMDDNLQSVVFCWAVDTNRSKPHFAIVPSMLVSSLICDAFQQVLLSCFPVAALIVLALANYSHAGARCTLASLDTLAAAG